MLKGARGAIDSNPVSPMVRAVLRRMIDSGIARRVDGNMASILEDALRSKNSGARDAKVKPYSLYNEWEIRLC